MSFRQKKAEVLRRKRYGSFLAANEALLERSGVPPSVTENERWWLYFLGHGCSHASFDPRVFSLEQMSDDEYRAFVEVLDAYFAAGFEFYHSLALLPSDREALEEKFGA